MHIGFWAAFFGVLAALIVWRLRRYWLFVVALALIGLGLWGAYQLHVRYPDLWRYTLGGLFMVGVLAGAFRGVVEAWSGFIGGLRGKSVAASSATEKAKPE